MATRTVKQGFEIFHSYLIPSSHITDKSSSHKSTIASKLEADFNLKQIFYSGSANNGTSISSYSDIDLFAWIPTSNLKKNSATSLRAIKESLQNRFPNTNIYVDSPAVVLDFGSGDWDTVEVIPADYIKNLNGKNIYEIPDGQGKWIKSSPSTHNSYVTLHNQRLNNNLKPLIRFIKAWKYFQNVPISSFYLELRITKWMENESTIIYDFDVCSVFRQLASCNLMAIQDPKDISGYVYPCSSEIKKVDAFSKLNTALTRAENAREAEKKGDTREAFQWWSKVFSNKFPNYYCY